MGVSGVSSVNVQNNVYTKAQNIEILNKYLNGEKLQDKPDTFSSSVKSAVGSAAVFEGIPLFNFLKRNKKLTGKMMTNETMKTIGETNKAAMKNLIKGEGKLSSRILDYMQTVNNSKEEYNGVKSLTKKAAKLLKKGVATSGDDALKLAEKEIAQKATGKAAEKVAETAAKEAGKTAAKTAAKSAGKLGKYVKSTGAGGMLIFSGAIETATEVVPTFKELGKEKGMKQVGKSAVKVVGDTVGFIGGQQIGLAAGTAIGTKVCAAVGTAACPGLGTAIGAVVGFVGGMLGSFVMGKVTKAIVGKTEREKAKEEEQKAQAQEISKNDKSIEELKAEVMEKIEADKADDGQLTEDSEIALAVLNNLENSNPFETEAA